MEWLEPSFIRQAFIAILLLSPLSACAGIHVLNFRMAFFSDAVGHSAFAGLAFGIILGAPPGVAMQAIGIVTGLIIMVAKRCGRVSADAAIGIIFSAVVAFGLAISSLSPGVSRQIQQFLYGDILVVSEMELFALCVLFLFFGIFEILCSNRFLLLSLGSDMDQRGNTFVEFIFASLLAMLVMFSVRAVGVLLVTALLIVPASAARNLAKSMCQLFWFAMCISTSCGIIGLYISTQPWAPSSGSTIILASCAVYAITVPLQKLRRA